ncbi:MAG: LytTR family transcriptional regulator DNA-binding domain-containing protein [Lachnospiraceae bacterium]|nr:LytTR family transcriptional regulator DNA-binding domain-containing protein [Lachnospiraceae bacterium]
MKISIEEIPGAREEEIVIRCHAIDEGIYQIINRIKTPEDTVIGFLGNQIHRISPRDVFYFEAVDNKVFIYTKNEVYESKQKLYEIEEMYGSRFFLRTSKSMIMNIKKIKYVSPAFNGRFEACFINDEKQIISRQYVGALKSKLML